MFKYIAAVVFFCLAGVSAGILETHHVVQQPVLTKVGAVVHSAPSAVSHQSITHYHNNKAVVAPVLTPVVKTTVHAQPAVSILKSEPFVQTYAAPAAAAAATFVHSVPAVHAAPLVQQVPSVSYVKTAPLVHSQSVPLVLTAPAAYTIHH